MKFTIGEDYTYDQIENLAHQSSIKNYGRSIIGENALHVSVHGMDYWFILDGFRGGGYVYKLAYKE